MLDKIVEFGHARMAQQAPVASVAIAS